MALDCLHRVLRFYLNVHAGSQPEIQVWIYLNSISTTLLSSLKKGSLTQDVQHDKLVDFCVTIADSYLDFSMNHMILELLRTELSEAKVIGLRALLAVVSSPSHHRYGSDTFGIEDLHSSATSSLRGTSTSWSYASSSACGETASEGHDIGPYIPKVRFALGAIIKSCHAIFGNLVMTSTKITTGWISA